MLYSESSERSEKFNQIKKKISTFDEFRQFSFEGYTTLNGSTSLLLDRLCATNDENLLSNHMINEIKKHETYYREKLDFANRLDVNWFFVVYKNNEHVVVFDMKAEILIQKFSSFMELGDFISKYSDKFINLSPYEEPGLPEIDKKMRLLSKSWPGNLDSVLYYHSDLVTIIEYQNTSRSVDQHDNNFFMEKRNGRKDDRGRWTVIDIVRRKLDTRLFVIVWSKSESRIHIKEIANMEYEGSYVSKIVWGKAVLLESGNLTSDMLRDIICK